MAKVGFISLGCPKNLVDSEVMIGILRQEGHTLTADPRQADVIVVNTCSFVRDATQESIDAVLEAARFKHSGRCRRLIVAGCLAERYPREIRRDLAEVDAVLGTNQIAQIARAVAGAPLPLPDTCGRGNGDLYLYDHTTPRARITPRHRAYVKIAEGCDHACSFCIIPRIRGRFRSRTIPSLMHEARRLAAEGACELVLVSQDTTSYGSDLGLEDGLARLLEALSGVEGIRWIRVLYMHPHRIGDRLLGVMAGNEKICRYVDVPLQHVSRRILRAMKRGGSRSMYARLLERIRARVPEVTLRTTMMVGFPGETEEDFRELTAFCREIEFDRLGVFEYSDEEGTASCDLRAKVPARTAARRKRELMQQQAAIAARRNRALVGRELPVLIEGPSEESALLVAGRLESQAPEIDGVCLINDSAAGPLAPGEFRTVRITRALGHDLLGTVVR